MEPWIRLGAREVFRQSPWLRLEAHHLRLPDGREIPDWLWVDTPDFCNVVAVTEADEFLCFRQSKYAAPGLTLALVGGYLEPEEDPRAAAQRELREESGHVAAAWRDLGNYACDGNRGCGRGHLFLATGCRYEGHAVSDDLEEQQLLRLSRAEAKAALLRGEFGVMPWTAALALALLAGE